MRAARGPASHLRNVNDDRPRLSQALRSDIRRHINEAIDELSEDGMLVTITTEYGRANRLRLATEL